MAIATHQHPCPACGFFGFDEAPGSYEICPVCDWEDDAVQLANPTSSGGANRESLADVQAMVLTRYPLSVRHALGLERDPAWRPLVSAELGAHAEQRAKGGHWPLVATQLLYWRTPVSGFETVHTMTDFWDAPRAGIADYQGSPHHYESTWSEATDDYTPWILRPVEPEVVALALEDWWIWLRWEEAFYAGQTDKGTHPALPEDRERHEELAQALASALPPKGAGVKVTAEFSTVKHRPDGGLGWRGLAVRWSRIA